MTDDHVDPVTIEPMGIRPDVGYMFVYKDPALTFWFYAQMTDVDETAGAYSLVIAHASREKLRGALPPLSRNVVAAIEQRIAKYLALHTPSGMKRESQARGPRISFNWKLAQ